MASAMSTSLKLWLIRHGQTEVNLGHWSANVETTSLTALGREQAKRASAEINLPPDLLIVSPLVRAKETAEFLLERWPQTPYQIWPIQEFLYLSPQRLQHLTPRQRKEEIKRYWQRQDPNYFDGEDSESFASFIQRVDSFYTAIRTLRGFIVTIGHGQFFKAFQLRMTSNFDLKPEFMRVFRQEETTHPIKNGEIVKLDLP